MNTSITETSLASVNVNFGDKYRLEFGQVRVWVTVPTAGLEAKLEALEGHLER